jgi:hypothetical protein
MSKPLSIAGLLKRKEEEKGNHPTAKYLGISTNNRFLLLAEKDKAAREPTLSAKRFRTDSECTEVSEINEGCSQEDTVFGSIEKTEGQLQEAKAVIEQVKAEVDKIPNPGPMKGVLEGLVKWMALTTFIQENTASVILDEFAKASKKVGPSGQSLQDTGTRKMEVGSKVRVSGEQDNPNADNPRRKKFIQAVKEAEKSTLVFNTDMGTVAVMNSNTKNRKFSMALKAKAAEVEGNANGEPKADTVTQLDNTLSMVKSMDYFGKTTKQAKGKEFFTIPVKLVYKDKDTRITAEQNLRKLCEVSSTTPYQSTLREVMRKAMEESKVKYKNSYVQTRLDVESMELKVSYRQDGILYNDVEKIPLPDSVYDLAHKVSKRTTSAPEGMDTDGGETVQG